MLQGYEVLATGQPPWRVVDTDVTLVVHNPAITTATLLDTSGYAVRKVKAEQAGDRLTVELPPNALYLVLE